MSSFPIKIATDRLTLRPYRAQDFDKMFALMSRPEIHLHPRRDPPLEEDVWTRLLRHVGHWQVFGFGFFTVDETGSGRYVGQAGLSWFRRGLGQAYDEAPEAGWTIAPEDQRQGYATEAVAAALRWAERECGIARTLCMIHPDNAPSLRVADKLGYREIAQVTYRSNPALMFERGAEGAKQAEPRV